MPNASVRPLNGPGLPPRHRTAPRRSSRRARPPRPATDPYPVPGAAASKDTDRTRGRTVASSAVKTDHRIRFSGTGQRAQESCHPTQVDGPAVTVIDGNQRMAMVKESGRGSGVEVTERDEAVIDSTARSQHDKGSNLHQRCRTRGVSSLRVPIYTPSHTSPYAAVSAKSLHINQIPTQHATPRCRNWVQGEFGERPCLRPAVFGPGRCSSVTRAVPGRSPHKTVPAIWTPPARQVFRPGRVSALRGRLWSADGRYPAGSVLPAITRPSTATSVAVALRADDREPLGRSRTTWGVEATAVLYPASPLETSVSGPP